ncbi:MAG: MOSC N-terminal beta barrel domain-containing protein [Reinekea sp.]
MIEIQQLFIYPIKSIAGISVDEIEMTMAGPRYDRQYMLVDERKRFMTQRSHPMLARFSVLPHPDGWEVLDGDGSLLLVRDEERTERIFETNVWSAVLQVREVSGAVSRWFSERFDQLVRLVAFDDLESRQRNVQGHATALQFADSYPLLICNQQSLDQTSAAVSMLLQMRRFRPNVVVSIPAEAEYALSTLVRDDGGKLILGDWCERCNVPAIDPLTGVFDRALHQSLKAALKREGRVVFGVNGAGLGLKSLQVGDLFRAVNGDTTLK